MANKLNWLALLGLVILSQVQACPNLPTTGMRSSPQPGAAVLGNVSACSTLIAARSVLSSAAKVADAANSTAITGKSLADYLLRERKQLKKLQKHLASIEGGADATGARKDVEEATARLLFLRAMLSRVGSVDRLLTQGTNADFDAALARYVEFRALAAEQLAARRGELAAALQAVTDELAAEENRLRALGSGQADPVIDALSRIRQDAGCACRIIDATCFEPSAGTSALRSSADAVRKQLGGTCSLEWEADARRLNASLNAGIDAAAVSASSLNADQRAAASQLLGASRRIADLVDRYSAAKTSLAATIDGERHKKIHAVAQNMIQAAALETGKFAQPQLDAVRQRTESILAKASSEAQRINRQLPAEFVDRDFEGSLKAEIRKIVGNQQQLSDTLSAVSTAPDAVRKARLGELSQQLGRHVNEAAHLSRSLTAVGATGIEELAGVSASFKQLSSVLADAPGQLSGQFQRTSSALLEKAQQDAMSAVSKALSFDKLASEMKGLGSLPDALKKQVEGLAGTFRPENIKKQLEEGIGGAPSITGAGFMVAAAAFTEMRASERHREVMKELKQISRKLEEMDRKLDQILELQRITNQKLDEIQKSLARLQSSQDAGFSAVLTEIGMLKDLLTDKYKVRYCGCRRLLSLPSEDSPRKEWLGLNRLGGATPHPACLDKAREALSDLYGKCWQQLVDASSSDLSILKRRNWSGDAQTATASAQQLQLRLDTYADLGAAVDWLRLCSPSGPKGKPAPAPTQVALDMSGARRQASELLGGKATDLLPAEAGKRLADCMAQAQPKPDKYFNSYFAPNDDLSPPLVLWHALAAGNLQMYERVRHFREPSKLLQADLVVGSSIRLLNRLGRPMNLQSGAPLLQSVMLAVNLRHQMRQDPAYAGCSGTDAQAQTPPCQALANVERFVSLTLSPVDTTVSQESPLLVHNLGTWLAWSMFTSPGYSKAAYVFAARAAAGGCRACLGAAIGPAWTLLHEDENADCASLVESRRQILKAAYTNDAAMLGELNEKGWCASVEIKRSAAVVQHLKRSTGNPDQASQGTVILPLPLASSLVGDELWREQATTVVTDLSSWLYREQLELRALEDLASPIGATLWLQLANPGKEPKCSASPAISAVPPEQLRALSYFQNLQSTKWMDQFCGPQH
jgi:hypothetical protein